MGKTITLKELAQILNINANGLRTMLNGYRFTKYLVKTKNNNRITNCYKFNKNFVQELLDYFEITHRYKPFNNLERFLRNFNFDHS